MESNKNFGVFDRLVSDETDKRRKSDTASLLKSNRDEKNNYDSFDIILTVGELTKLNPSISKLLIELVGRQAAIYVCPVEMKGGQYAILCAPEYRKSNILKGSLDLMERTYKKVPHIITVDSTLLLTLVYEGEDKLKETNSIETIDSERSELSQAFKNLISWAVDQKASDIHININTDKTDSQVYATIDGHYVAPPHWRLPTSHLLDMAKVAWLGNKGGRGAVLDMRNEQQGRLYESIQGRPYMLRWGSFITDVGPSITLRIQDLDSHHKHMTFETMGYLPTQVEMFHRAQLSEGGAIVLGGIPGSGKTTTISNLLASLPRSRKAMSIEDPVEIRLDNVLQATISRGGNTDEGDPFHSKLMMLKRSAPSDAFLGEIRDTVTGRAFQDITESGTNLYSTVHALSALAIAERLASRQVGVPIELLSMPNVLKLVGYQALLPILCQNCSLPIDSLYKGGQNSIGLYLDGDSWRSYFDVIFRIYDIDLSKVRVRNTEGCKHCQEKGLPEIYGYGGRTVVAELFELGQHREALIAVRNRDTIALSDFYEGLRVAKYDEPDMNGKTAMECAVYKMAKGLIDPRDIEPRFSTFDAVAQMKGIVR